MKYDLIEGSSEIGGYTILGDILRVNLPDNQVLDVPLEHCNFKDNRLFFVKPAAMLARGQAVPMNRYKLWVE